MSKSPAGSGLPDVRIDELLAFAQAHPWSPAWPEPELRAFLGRLISGPRQLIEVFDAQGQRLAAAVLLDKVRNLGKLACLEFLGMVEGVDRATVLSEILSRAEALLRPAQAGYQLGQYQQAGLDAGLLRRHGCELYYEMYEMRCPQAGSLPSHRPDTRAVALTAAGFQAYYELLCAAFAANPDTSISDYDSAYAAWQAKPGQIWLIGPPDRPLAFVNLLPDAESGGEIRTLGVAPAARGQGYGKALLGHALAWLAAHRPGPCSLSVAVLNARALDLYQALGFEVVDHSACWRRLRP